MPFNGLIDALVGSFAGEPQLHQPLRGASMAPGRRHRRLDPRDGGGLATIVDLEAKVE